MRALTCLLVIGFSLCATTTPSMGALIAVTTTDNASTEGDGQLSLLEALQSARDGDSIQFQIPGDGPHFIRTPLGGYPMITVNGLTLDGYSQPGSAPNTAPFNQKNNARLSIVLDSTSDEMGDSAYLDKPALVSRRSTRMLNADGSDISGYGDSENGILAVYGAKQFTVRGLCFLGRHTDGNTADPSIYAIALAKEAVGAKVQGCWFGLNPDGSTVNGLRAAVAAFRHRSTQGGVTLDIFSSGLIYGTDGDGAGDRGEGNIAVGVELTLGLELPGARISGNRFNVFPDGLTFLDMRTYSTEHHLGSMEVFENGRSREGTLIGTDGDGVSDAEERNVFAPVNYKHMFEFYGGTSAEKTVIAGNLIGVGVDEVTPYPFDPIGIQDFMSMDGAGGVRVGSNGDGVSDGLEGNVIRGLRGTRFLDAASSVRIVARANVLGGNNFAGFPFVHMDRSRDFLKYYNEVLTVPATLPTDLLPVLSDVTEGFLTGSLPDSAAETYPHRVLDVYTRDMSVAGTGAVIPGNYLGTFIEGSTQDSHPESGEFRVPVSSFYVPEGAELVVVETFAMNSGRWESSSALTGPASVGLPAPASVGAILLEPVLAAGKESGEVVLSWRGSEGTFRLEASSDLEPRVWRPVAALAEHSDGVNRVRLSPSSAGGFFRLRSL